MNKVIVSPSILNIDFSKLKEECVSLEQSGADWIHCDIMDGVFVPNVSLGVDEVSQIHTCVSLPLDVHLMVQNPLAVVERYVDAGASIVTFHIETECNVAEVATAIRKRGAKVGISVKPATPIEALLPYKDYFDMILIMSVEPGFGGQKFMESSVTKIRNAKRLFPDKIIEVDGGINAQTAQLVKQAGADALVAGSYVIFSENRKNAILNLRNL